MFQVREHLEKVITEINAFEVQIVISEISRNWNKLVHCGLGIVID